MEVVAEQNFPSLLVRKANNGSRARGLWKGGTLGAKETEPWRSPKVGEAVSYQQGVN